MSTIRGRFIKGGGVAVQPVGAAGRTDTTTTGQPSILRPAYTFAGQVFKPTMPATLSGILDFRSVLFWRLVILAAAVGYVVNYHIKIPVVGRVRV